MSDKKRKKTILIDQIFGELVFWPLTLFTSRKKINLAPEEIHEILLIRPGGIGDYLLSIPAFKKIRAACPHARITMFIFSRNKSCLQFYADFDEVVVIDKPKNLFRFLLRRKKYDVCIDFDQHRKIPAILSLLSRAAMRMGFDRMGKTPAYNYSIPYPPREYVWKSFLNLLSPLMPIEDLSETDLMLLPQGTPIPQSIGIYACAMKEGNRLPLETWRDIITAKGNAYTYYFFGGPLDTERYDALAALLPGFSIVRYDGKYSLIESQHKIGEMEYFISEDGGVYHMAVCANIPTESYWLHGDDDATKWSGAFPKHTYHLYP